METEPKGKERKETKKEGKKEGKEGAASDLQQGTAKTKQNKRSFSPLLLEFTTIPFVTNGNRDLKSCLRFRSPFLL